MFLLQKKKTDKESCPSTTKFYNMSRINVSKLMITKLMQKYCPLHKNLRKNVDTGTLLSHFSREYTDIGIAIWKLALSNIWMKIFLRYKLKILKNVAMGFLVKNFTEQREKNHFLLHTIIFYGILFFRSTLHNGTLVYKKRSKEHNGV